MTADILTAMGTALLLTIMLEGLFGVIWGVRGGRNYLIMLLANILTNPLVNVIHSFCAYELKIGKLTMLFITFFLEASAVTAEGFVYKSRTDINKPFLFSLSANAFSFFCGIILNMIM